MGDIPTLLCLARFVGKAHRFDSIGLLTPSRLCPFFIIMKAAAWMVKVLMSLWLDDVYFARSSSAVVVPKPTTTEVIVWNRPWSSFLVLSSMCSFYETSSCAPSDGPCRGASQPVGSGLFSNHVRQGAYPIHPCQSLPIEPCLHKEVDMVSRTSRLWHFSFELVAETPCYLRLKQWTHLLPH
jgi:hypothetical protein